MEMIDLYDENRHFPCFSRIWYSELKLQEEEVRDAKWATIYEVKQMIEKGEFCQTIMDSLVLLLEYINR